MSPLDFLNCNIIVYPTKGTLLFADVIMTVYYESIRLFLMEPTEETNVICRLMFGYENKKNYSSFYIFLCYLVSVMENGTIGEGQIL